jgi:hypothetical protein
MADLTKCQDDTCPQRSGCYRWTAPASVNQSYFAASPRTGAACFYFWKREPEPQGIQPVTDRLERDADGMPVRFYPETRKG